MNAMSCGLFERRDANRRRYRFTRWHVWWGALAIALLQLVVQSAMAASGDETCFPLYRETGATPGTQSCALTAATASVGLATYYCTGSSSPERISRYCGTSPKDFGRECRLDRPTVGNPIDIANGNKFTSEVDYAGPSGLLLTRDYNSSTHAMVGGTAFGTQWRTNFLSRLQLYPATGPTTVLARRPGGSGIYYQMVSGAWTPDADIRDRLRELKNASGTTIGWSYYDAATQIVETYDATGALLSWQPIAGAKTTLTFSTSSTPSSIAPGAGYAITMADFAGHQLNMRWNSAGRVAVITDPAGSEIRYTYSNNLLTNVGYPLTPGTAAANVFTRQYHWNEAANTQNTSLPSALTGISEETSSEVFTRIGTYQYDATGRAVATEQAGGVNKYSIAFGSGSVTVTDPHGTARTSSFQSILGIPRRTSQDQPSESCGGDNVASLNFDTRGNANDLIDFNGNRTCRAFDAHNLETARLEGLPAATSCPSSIAGHVIATPPAGSNMVERKYSSQWHPDWNLKVREAAPGLLTTWVYNGQPDLTAGGAILTCAPTAAQVDGRPIAALCRKIEQPTTDVTGSSGFNATATGAARVWNFTYDANGQLLSLDGSRTDVSDVTTIAYYNCNSGTQCGRVYTVTNALNQTTTYTAYDAHGQPLSLTDPNGIIVNLAYDLRQRIKSWTVGSETTTFTYYDNGLVRRVTLPDSSFLEYTYDAAHRLIQIQDADGNKVVYTLDAMGNRTKQDVFDSSNALSRTQTQVFNSLNRLSQQIGATGGANVTTSYGYDNNGNQTGIDAPLGRNTTQSYDELNRLKQVTDPASGVTKYGYDALDQLISVSDPRNKVTSYTYNGLGDLTSQVSPDTGTTTSTYDSNGNVKTNTDARGKTVTYSYDALNRVTQAVWPDQTIGYQYDGGANALGRLSKMSNTSGQTSWSYDAQGRVAGKTQTVGSMTKSVSYAYINGNLTTLKTPSGQTVSYGYTNGRITSVGVNSTIVLSNVLYEPFGPAGGWTWGNGTLAVRGFDQDGKVQYLDSAGLKNYSYDDAFRLTGITDATDATKSQSYTYDVLDRLTSATGTYLNQSWSYDANGNRLSQGGSQASTYTVSATSNRLSAISGALTRSYTYDAAGHVTADGLATYVYNDVGRLISATKAGVTTTYALNGLGQRVHKSIGGIGAYFVYDEAGHLLGDYDNWGNLIQETVWLGDIPVAVLKPNGSGGVNVFHVHTDHLNTPRKITRPSDNAIVWRWDSDPFGRQAVDPNPSGLGIFVYNLRFAGQYYDVETGNYYNYFRDYDPATGRYIQSDPIGLDGGLNTYGYVGGNPLSYVDPLGLWSMQFGGYLPRVGPAGFGGAVTLTFDGLSPTSISGRVGFGAGGGLQIDPFGSMADSNACSGDNGIGVYGEWALARGPIGVGGTWRYGGTQHPNGPGMSPTWHEYGPGWDRDTPIGAGFREGWAATIGAGFEFTHYF